MQLSTSNKSSAPEVRKRNSAIRPYLKLMWDSERLINEVLQKRTSWPATERVNIPPLSGKNMSSEANTLGNIFQRDWFHFQSQACSVIRSSLRQVQVKSHVCLTESLRPSPKSFGLHVIQVKCQVTWLKSHSSHVWSYLMSRSRQVPSHLSSNNPSQVSMHLSCKSSNSSLK